MDKNIRDQIEKLLESADNKGIGKDESDMMYAMGFLRNYLTGQRSFPLGDAALLVLEEELMDLTSEMDGAERDRALIEGAAYAIMRFYGSTNNY